MELVQHFVARPARQRGVLIMVAGVFLALFGGWLAIKDRQNEAMIIWLVSLIVTVIFNLANTAVSKSKRITVERARKGLWTNVERILDNYQVRREKREMIMRLVGGMVEVFVSIPPSNALARDQLRTTYHLMAYSALVDVSTWSTPGIHPSVFTEIADAVHGAVDAMIRV